MWLVAGAWCDTLKSLGQLYDTFYTQSCNHTSILTEIPGRETVEGTSDCSEVSVQATVAPTQGVPEGNGVPHHDCLANDCLARYRLSCSLHSRMQMLKSRMLNSYLQTLCQHMWRYKAVQGEYRATSLDHLCLDDDWMNALAIDGNFHLGTYPNVYG